MQTSTKGAIGLDPRPNREAVPPRQTRPKIQTENLTKRFGAKTVVDDVSFRVEPGTVTGFLGANGAGKTTTLRLLTGLSQPDGGEAVVLGGRYRDLPNPGRRVGVLLDAAAQHSGRRGREALAVSAQLMGVDQRRVSELLDLVGLDRSAARKRVRHYSLGMRQRLGIAHALLGDPEVLILDEPANGLDPPGIRWMRELLRDFADRGGTVLLSSHLLHEVQALADRVLIIDLGRILAEGSLADLLAGSGTVVRGDDDVRLGAALDAAGLEARPGVDGGFVVEARPELVGRAALAGGVALSRLAPSDGSGLEQLFFDLTAGASNGARTDRVEVPA
jgi:ABC-2 type transport system ATP-binding protein